MISKSIPMKIIIATIFLQLLCADNSFSQISVYGASADVLINEVLSGQSISITNIQFWGSPNSIGYFNGNCMNIPYENGILMTTGDIHYALGPNDVTNSGVDNNYNSINPHLSALVNGAPCYNGANIEFDFIPTGDSLILEYVFGSEEYPEYNGSQFTDVFGIFLSGPGINGYQNIATLPNGTIISINTLNGGNPDAEPPLPPVNPEYFVNNGIPLAPPYTTDSAYVEYDGLTVPLVASAFVTPNQTYHLEIAITDVADGILDSGVFLKAHSLTAGNAEFNISEAFSVSPNPATDVLAINYNRSAPGKVMIYDITGRCFGQQDLLPQTNISISDLPKGIYTLKFITSEGQCSRLISKL